MNKLLRHSLLPLCFALARLAHAQHTITDPAFAAALQAVVPAAMNGNVLDTTHASVLSLVTLDLGGTDITNLNGVRFFTALDTLYINSTEVSTLPTLPASLRWLDCSYANLTSLPANLPNGLQHLDATGNDLVTTPVLPASLRYLDLMGNSLVTLGPLPAQLETLHLQGNNLSSLPALPSTLLLLHAVDNQLTSLPQLPEGLVKLVLSYNELTTLPPLPSTLIELFTPSNNLVSLPALPNGLRKLSTMANQLTALPTLPDSLRDIHATYNQLTTAPALPDSLKALGLSGNQITELPPLPSHLEELWVNGNPIACLPALPVTLLEIATYQTAISCLPNMPPNLVADQGDLGFAPVVCAPAHPCALPQAISGVLFFDTDGDGLFSGSERALPNGVVELLPGPYLAGADGQGRFAAPVAAGTYTVQGAPKQYHTITTEPYTITIAPATADTTVRIGYQPIPGIHDLVADIQATVTRPGFENQINLHVTNVGTETSEASIQLYITAEQAYVGSSVEPTFQSGTYVQWDATLAPGESWSATVTVTTDAAVPLGTGIMHMITAGPVEIDTVPEDNVAKWEDQVVGSYDPNDKRVAQDTVALEEVVSGAWSDYTIRFQNTGSFLAERVVITDTLSADLDHQSITFISSSHNAQWVLSNGVLVFTFEDIQLPDSASDPIGSQGYVHFRMKLEQDLLPGDVITNIANIYFDFNAPVITEPALTSIVLETAVADPDAVHQQHVIAPNPANDRAVLQLPIALERSAQFALYDVTGRLVYQAMVPTGTLNFAFPTHHAAPGLHFFTLVSDQHPVASGPVMVLH